MSSTSAWTTSADRRSPTSGPRIEGASQGAGLGHAFLRHVERTRVLVHVVDGSDRDRWNHRVIHDELEAHDPALLEKPMIVAFNKMDVPAAAAAWPAFRAAREREGLRCVAIAAATGEGIAELRTLLAAELPDADELGTPPGAAGVVVHRIESLGDGFVVEREEDAFRVRGRRIERIAAQTDFENEESAGRFQRDLAKLDRPSSAAPGSPPATWSASARSSSGVGPRGVGGPMTIEPGPLVLPPAPVVPVRRSSRRHVRPDPSRPPGDRRGGP